MVYLARMRIEISFTDDDVFSRLHFEMGGATCTQAQTQPYGALAELEALLSAAKTALGGQARELAMKLTPREEQQ